MEATQLQQLGLCYQKMEMYDQAISVYTRADLMKPDSYWTILHLAQCYRELEQHDKALEYYKIAEEMKPENLNLTLHVAEQLYETGEYEEASPRLHKLLYHHPESLKTLRLLAECSFMCRQNTQAAKYYERMMAEHTNEMTSADWKFAAYNYWLLRRRDECFRCLSRAEELHEPYDEEYVTFADIIYKSSNLAQLIGGSQEEAFYMYDAYHRTKHKS
jgi:tetratricopeptide (TPR) repeat protein